MAQLRLQPQKIQSRVASGLVADDAVKQISAILYCLGKEAEAVLDSTNITLEVYDTVVGKLTTPLLPPMSTLSVCA